MSRSLLSTALTATTAVANGAVVPLGNAVHGYGCNIRKNGNAIDLCGCGYYTVSAIATVAAASTGPLTLTLNKDGIPVEGGIATTTVPGTSDDVILSITRTIYIPKYCSGASLSFVLSGLDEVSVDNFTVDAFKH